MTMNFRCVMQVDMIASQPTACTAFIFLVSDFYCKVRASTVINILSKNMATFNYSPDDISTFHKAALKLIQEAGNKINEAINDRGKVISEKLSPTDLVTETDKAVETLLVDGLRQQFPEHQFIGEEDKSAQRDVGEFTNCPTWIIDPIDGTMNFVHSNPMVSISVCLAINKQLVIGIISLPVLGRLYSAIKGQGATMNGKPIKVSNCTEVGQAQVIFEAWSRDGQVSEQRQINNFSQIVAKAHSIRCMGSAAINLAFLANGHCDLYHHVGLHCWDVAAGAVIVREAGGVVLDPSGREFDLMSRRMLVASSQALVQDWLQTVKMEEGDYKRDLKEVCIV